MQRVMVFIDGNNLREAINGLYGEPENINYKKFSEYIAEKFNGFLQRLYYYTAQGNYKSNPTKYDKQQSFIDALRRISRCFVRVGYLKSLGQDASGKDIYVEKSTDVNVCIDMISLAYNNAYDIAILVSADTDYENVIRKVQELGKVVIVCAIDGQKVGFLKEIADDIIILTKAELDTMKIKKLWGSSPHSHIWQIA